MNDQRCEGCWSGSPPQRQSKGLPSRTSRRRPQTSRTGPTPSSPVRAAPTSSADHRGRQHKRTLIVSRNLSGRVGIKQIMGESILGGRGGLAFTEACGGCCDRKNMGIKVTTQSRRTTEIKSWGGAPAPVLSPQS